MVLCGSALSQTSSSVKSGKQAPLPPPTKPVLAKLQLATSETLFSALAAINNCGFDLDLANSNPLRLQIRTEVADAVNASLAASNAREQLCRFYQDKQLPDPARNLAQYVSLALYLREPPDFVVAVRDSDLPPDAYEVLGFATLLKDFYAATNLHAIWVKHAADYEKLIAQVHDPVADMVSKTDIYLKLPESSYLGRKYIVFVEPLGAPAQVNARNFSADYFLVITPGASGVTRLDLIRHTYLHYVLDALMAKHLTAIKRLEPLMQTVKTAPMDESFKNDTALLVTECLIQAVEARTFAFPTGPKTSDALEKRREEMVENAMKQGYVLTRYFHDSLVKFEKDPIGLRDAFTPMLVSIDVDREKRRASNVVFSAKAAPELIQSSAPRRSVELLDFAEDRLAAGDGEAARRFAQEALDQRQGDPAHAMFVMARAAVLNKQIDDAQMLFERTLEIAHEPKTVAWSHIYIARILDLKCEREPALSHYRSALNFSQPSPDIKAAADKGIKEPPSRCQKTDEKE